MLGVYVSQVQFSRSWSQDFGTHDPRSQDQGFQFQGSGFQGPVKVSGPRVWGLRSQGLGSQIPGSRVSRSQGFGSQVSGSQIPGSRVSGSGSQGLKFPGLRSQVLILEYARFVKSSNQTIIQIIRKNKSILMFLINPSCFTGTYLKNHRNILNEDLCGIISLLPSAIN